MAPITFRHPALLARQAAALDDLSGGRMILGVGAGWMEREHKMFGYPLGDPASRLARFAEGLEVIDSLLHSDAPVNFHGTYFNLQDAEIRPRTGTTRILVGGNGLKKTLRLAAKHASVWNGVGLTPEEFRERSAVLDVYTRELGRDPRSIKRTVASFLFFGNSDAELESRLTYVRTWNADYASMPLGELCRTLRERHGGIAGDREQVLEQIRAYAEAGVEELMLQWFNPQDTTGMQEFARDVLPNAV